MTVGRLLLADARQIPLPDRSVHCVVTSPPYFGLRAYRIAPSVWGGAHGCAHEFGHEARASGPAQKQGATSARKGRGNVAEQSKRGNPLGVYCARCGAWRGCLGNEPTLQEYVEHLVEVFREVRRVLRDDGTLWLNIGDSFSHGGCGARDPEKWPKQSRNDHMPVHGKRLTGVKPKDLLGVPWRVAFALQDDGWWLRSDIVWHKVVPMPESVEDRPTRAHEFVFLLAKSEVYYYDHEAVKEPLAASTLTRLSQPTFDEQQGGEKDYRNGVNSNRSIRKIAENVKASIDAEGGAQAGRNMRDVWSLMPEPSAEGHFAVMPTALARPCIRAGTSARGCCTACGMPFERVVGAAFEVEGRGSGNVARKVATEGERDRTNTHLGSSIPWKPTAVPTEGWRRACGCGDGAGVVPCTVLDPFVGSGTVVRVAGEEGRDAVGLDLSEEYLEIARRRGSVTPPLFIQ